MLPCTGRVCFAQILDSNLNFVQLEAEALARSGDRSSEGVLERCHELERSNRELMQGLIKKNTQLTELKRSQANGVRDDHGAALKITELQAALAARNDQARTSVPLLCAVYAPSYTRAAAALSPVSILTCFFSMDTYIELTLWLGPDARRVALRG